MLTTPNQGSPDGAYVVASGFGQDMTESTARAIMKGGVINSFTGAQDIAHLTYNDVIDDHSASITALQAAFNQLILQGLAIVFTSNNTYTPSDGIVSIEVIIIGAGAGGAAGRWDLITGNQRVGGGGGGGGEVHTVIPASLLPKTGDHFDPISITIGAGGPGGSSDAASGNGGGNTLFGSYLTAGGGQGGVSNGGGTGGGNGGSGMIPGGDGGNAGSVNPDLSVNPTDGGVSTSAYSLNGGGGGGGGGRGVNSTVSAHGGQGGISPGGTPGTDGTAPSSVVATGGGGGGGSASTSGNGGNGAFPAGGGGGGGGGSASPRGNGGNGGNGILFVIERMS